MSNSQKIIAALEEENVRAYKVRVRVCVRMCFVGAWCDLVMVCAQELSDVLVGKLIKKRGAGAGDQEIVINRSGACMG